MQLELEIDDPLANRTLQSVVGIFENSFESRIRGYYLEGSYADGTALTTSDIDLVILFKDAFIDARERARAEKIAHYIDAVSGVELDIEFLSEDAIAQGVPPSLKLGSTVIYGEPITDNFPLIPVEVWARERTHAAYWLITQVFERGDTVTYPLDYPKPDAEFYGYTERKILLEDGSRVNSTRNLIRVIGWAGTALIALLGKQIVTRKKECHLMYREYINDEWSSLFELIYEKCRMEWQYMIPEAPSERALLRHICEQALQFENHFLRTYKQFLLSELASPDSHARAKALEVQRKVAFVDESVAKMM